ncbi:type II toxin-antitoxin system Phd/YefM family antitoxin [Mesorhizobium sp. CN2-181]|uniref:type II toxin-antitoxin system Phd/YefM family antitoxin n=1 Tax=Mesorhizobium yinganensis TaxID=3157707 RepID=UPI0032B85E28
MPSFTLTELNNRSGEVVEAAYEGPVDITSRGKRRFVIMTAAHYDRLKGKSAQRAHHVDHLSEEERRDFLAAMDAVAADAEAMDG